MKWPVLPAIVSVFLSGCGVVFPYMRDAGKLDDRLVVAMPKEQVLNKLGKPDRIIQEDTNLAVWAYWLYPKDEWVGYLVHCPFHPFCYFPIEPPAPYYVALQQDQVCMWGTPEVVRTLAWKICGSSPNVRSLARREETAKGGLKVSVIPVFMPHPVSPPSQRLAVFPLPGGSDDRVTSWLDLTLNFLRSRHPHLVLVEREDLWQILKEVGIQYSGRVDDETAIRVGKLTGADTLLAYRLAVTGDHEALNASFELRLLKVESGGTLFRQITTATATLAKPEAGARWLRWSNQIARSIVVDEAAGYGLAALAAAYGDNPLGVVPDYSWPREGVKLLGLLQGSPGYLAGLKQGDRIVAFDGRPVQSWTQLVSLPVLLTVERDGDQLEVRMGSRSEEEGTVTSSLGK
jgi:hypothetical protein